MGSQQPPRENEVQNISAEENEEHLDRKEAKLRVAVLHLLVSDASTTRGLERIFRQASRLRLGACITASGHIPDDVCARAVESARILKEMSDAHRPDRMFAVATAAIRDADNGVTLAGQIGEAIGIPVRVLRGEEEARLIFAAFRHRLMLGSGLTLGADLGGGSLELALGDDAEVHWETTLRVGVASLHGEIVRHDPMTHKEREEILRHVRSSLVPHRKRIATSESRRCIVSGGTIRALARLLTESSDAKERWRSEGSAIRIKRRQLERLTQTLVASKHDERLAMPGIKKSRADLLPTGAVILFALLEACGMKELVACDWGLREGVVLEAMGLASADAR
jgi:exopolyphosphatase/guanosine-5'-triphosphate,3'-diphosphate pyrophosphatase